MWHSSHGPSCFMGSWAPALTGGAVNNVALETSVTGTFPHDACLTRRARRHADSRVREIEMGAVSGKADGGAGSAGRQLTASSAAGAEGHDVEAAAAGAGPSSSMVDYLDVERKGAWRGR